MNDKDRCHAIANVIICCEHLMKKALEDNSIDIEQVERSLLQIVILIPPYSVGKGRLIQ